MLNWDMVKYREGYVEYQAAVGSFWLIVVEFGGCFSGRVVNSSNSICLVADIKSNLEEAKEAIEETLKNECEEALSVFAGHCGCEGGEFACDGGKHKE